MDSAVGDSLDDETRLADDVSPDEEWTDTPGGDPELPALASLTLETVAENNSEASCWTVIGDSVYDLTDWISQHPGGAGNIISLCGTDGTSQFQGRHGGSQAPESTLESYRLGALESN
jgi:cytochrome b involved in lipid metabolism